MNKKIIIICTVGVLLLTSLAVLAYVNYTKTINYYLDSMKSLSIKNGWSTEDDFNGCNQEKESCLRFAVATIRAGSTNKLSEINAWSDYFDQRQSKIEASLANKDYKEMLKETNSYIEEVNRTYNEKKPKEKALKKEIDEVLAKSPLKGKYTITKYKIENEWVAAEIVPTVKNNDKAFVVLKKEGENWTVISGPGTYLDPDKLSIAGVPESIINALDNDLNGSSEVYN